MTTGILRGVRYIIQPCPEVPSLRAGEFRDNHDRPLRTRANAHGPLIFAVVFGRTDDEVIANLDKLQRAAIRDGTREPRTLARATNPRPN